MVLPEQKETHYIVYSFGEWKGDLIHSEDYSSMYSLTHLIEMNANVATRMSLKSSISSWVKHIQKILENLCFMTWKGRIDPESKNVDAYVCDMNLNASCLVEWSGREMLSRTRYKLFKHIFVINFHGQYPSTCERSLNNKINNAKWGITNLFKN